MAFRCLGLVHPVTHTVGSTFKHIYFMTASIMVYIAGVVNIYGGITGVLLYTLAMMIDDR